MVGDATKIVQAPMSVYIHRFLTPALLIGMLSLCMDWRILKYCYKNILILEVCVTLWDWLRVLLLTDYVGDLDQQLTHLTVTP